MPMLGIMASAISGNLWAPTGAYDSISSVTLSAVTPSITFTGIPSTYTHLQVRALMKSTTTGTSINDIWFQLNGDTNSNYATHYLFGAGSGTPTSGAATTQTKFFAANAAPYVGNTPFGVMVTDILDYGNINKYKTARSLAGADLNGTGWIGLSSGLWMSTAAVTSITILPGANSFDTNTQISLYGVK